MSPKANDYYTRLDACADCGAKRGERCTKNGRNLPRPHISRVQSSPLPGSKDDANRTVQCPSCNAEVGAGCRGPFGDLTSTAHVARRKKAAKLRETQEVSTEST